MSNPFRSHWYYLTNVISLPLPEPEAMPEQEAMPEPEAMPELEAMPEPEAMSEAAVQQEPEPKDPEQEGKGTWF